MKDVTMFILSDCPYCHQASRMMESLCEKHPEYKSVKFTIIDEAEQVDLANSYDYYYVPTFYVGEEKIMEGVPTLQKVEKVYLSALEK